MRGATDFLLDIILGVTISIHAPARGATRSATTGAHTFRHFNPRTREGCDSFRNTPRSASQRFQSTHPRGVRPQSWSFCCQRSHFNPRTPCGVRREVWDRHRRGQQISIHAPHAGCDPCGNPRKLRGKNFNPRTPCGVRPR